jgi:beta-lactamase regulating signal transducer with metallopeptidase domain
MNPDPTQTFAINVAIHVSALSLAVWSAAKCFSNPHTRSRVAALGLLAIGTMPWVSATFVPKSTDLATIPIRVVEAPATVKTQTVGVATVPPQAEAQPKPVTPKSSNLALPSTWSILMALWIFGTLAGLARLIRLSVRMHFVISSMRKPTASEHAIIFRHAPPCRVRISPAAGSPFVTGIIRPTLVVPENLLHSSQEEKLVWALRHETGHLHANDLRWLAAFQFIRAVFWWNPLVHSIQSIWSEAREWICDQLAESSDQKRRAYGEFLISLGGQRNSGSVMSMAPRGSLERMKRRIRHLLEGKHHRPCNRSFGAALAITLCLLASGISQIGLRAETGPAPTATPIPSQLPVPEDFAQAKIVSRMIISSGPVAAEGKPLSSITAESLIKTLAEKGGIVKSLPSITSRLGQSAMLEIIWEHPDNPEPPASTGPGRDDEPPAPGSDSGRVEADHHRHPIYDPAYRFAGIRILYQTKPDGKNISLTCMADYRHFSDNPEPPGFEKEPPARIPWKNLLESRAATQDLRMQPGESACVEFGEISPGRHATLLVTAVPIDRTGREIADFLIRQSVPKTPAVPPAAAARIEGFFVDAVTNQENLPPPGAIASLYSVEQVEELKKSLKGPVTEIPTMELPAGKHWQKFSKDLHDLRIIARGWENGQSLAELLIAIRVDPAWTTLTLRDLKDRFAAVELPASAGAPSRILFLRASPL